MVTVIKKGADKKDINKALAGIKPKRKLNAKKYAGTLSLKESPVTIQKKLRNEWE